MADAKHWCDFCKGEPLVWVGGSNCGPGGGYVPCANVPRPNLPQHSDSARLAGEMHTTQWALDDLAHEVSANRDGSDALVEMADRLETVARVLRVRAGNRIINGALERPERGRD